jgi:hypothetical protein
VPVQHSLSAVVSVPSWWTALGVQIDTCWVDQQDEAFFSSRDAKRELCKSKHLTESLHGDRTEYVVRLPGSPAELPRKFEYEIERVPRIEPSGSNPYLAEFFVGQKNASLLIMGAELWRSTVVTMGSQKADKIEVLPNMKGIIARFDKVQVPDRKMNSMPDSGGSAQVGCHTEVGVHVWTSEGKTEHAYPVRIFGNTIVSRDQDANLNEPDGFGICGVLESSRTQGKASVTGSDGGSQDTKGSSSSA